MARAESPLKARSAGSNTGEPEALQPWPHDANGEPMIQITFQASELIGLKDYSNITVGPANITMFVAKGQDKALTEKEDAALSSSLNQIAELLEVDVIQKQRQIALDTIDPSKR